MQYNLVSVDGRKRHGLSFGSKLKLVSKLVSKSIYKALVLESK